MTPPSSRPRQRIHQTVLVSAFLSVLLAGLLGTAFHWDFHRVERENRRMATFPRFDQIALAQWPEAYETYFNDHFGFRNTFIHRYRKLMRSAGVSDYRVIYGRNDWLFLNEDTIMQDFIGTREFDEELCSRQVQRLEDRKQWLADRDISYLFFVAPNKITIYPDQLPTDMAKPKARKTNRMHFMEHLPTELGETVLDLTPALQEASKELVVYLRNDTHWNPAGAYIAYTNMAANILRLIPNGALAIPPEQIERTHMHFIGDLANMTVMPDRYSMDIELLNYSDKSQWSTTIVNDPTFLSKDTLPIDNQPPVTIHNPSGQGDAVVLHDSFGLRLKDYLPYNFKNTTFIWRYSNRTLLPLVFERFHPDIVIEECVERHLIDPQNGALLDDLDMERRSNGL